MTLQADQLVDRRALKRRLRLWRAFAIIAIAVALSVVFFGNDPKTSFAFSRQHIARVNIEGLIRDDVRLQNLLAKMAKNNSIKAVIIKINSPGGTTTGSEALFLSIRKLAKHKPVIAVLGTVAASGGYITAIAADYIVARGNTITGSIGVIFQYPQISGLLEKLGVKMETIKSSPLKGEPSPFTPTSKEARKAAEIMVRDSYEWFVRLVSERRSIKHDRARILADGRIYTGRIAVKNGLVDEIGGEETAVRWLTQKRRVKPGLKILNWKLSSPEKLGFGSTLIRALLRISGLDAYFDDFAIIGKTLNSERLRLDGLVSVWHPER